MNVDKELNMQLLRRSEDGQRHTEYGREYGFYEHIASGNIAEVTNNLSDPNDTSRYESGEFGQLSNDPIRNLKYHFVVSTALITRICVEKGLDREIAYNISDLYISRMDTLERPDEILSLHNRMALYFTRKMAALPRNRAHSVYVIRAMEYITGNLTQRLLVEDISTSLGLNPNYLSKLFLKETGVKLSDFIRREKLKEAASLLKYSDRGSLDIAMYLSFCSQSSFVQCFKKEYGITPGEFRRRYARNAIAGGIGEDD